MFEEPTSVSPSWMADQELVGLEESHLATIRLMIPNEVIVFDFSWFKCKAEREGIELSTADETDFERLRDLAVGILRLSGKLSPSAMGINRAIHFSVPRAKEWHAVGDGLTRNDIWKGALHLAGLKSLTEWGARQDHYGGHVEVRIEPSGKYPLGIFVQHNDHFDLTTTDGPPLSRDDVRVENIHPGTEKVPTAMQILSEEWEASMKRSRVILASVAKFAGGEIS